MDAQLRIKLPGSEGNGNARRSLAIVGKLLHLLGQLEDEAVRAGRGGRQRTTWAIRNVKLNSLDLTLAPNRLGDDVTLDLIADIGDWAVDGFAVAEIEDVLPEHWTPAAGSTGIDLGKDLGLLPSDGMELSYVVDGQVRHEVVVTRNTAEHLIAATKRKSTELGSVIGRLDTASTHSNLVAALWTDLHGERVEVRFAERDKEVIRAAWDKRVEVVGLITSNAWGRPTSIGMTGLEVLPTVEESPPLTDLIGADPDMTGDLTVEEHLERLRDAS